MFSQILRRGPQPQARSHPQPAFRHRAMHDWERRLHSGLRVTWPCEEALELQALWPSVAGRVRAIGGDSDFNMSLARGIWCLVRHLKPKTIVEAGVGTGITARFVLEALAMNRAGHLYSIEPPSIGAHKTGIAVEPRVAHRWSLISDTTKRAMPGLLSRLGTIDMYIHNLARSGHDMRHEIDLAWGLLKPGGAMVIDRIDSNGAFQYFAQSRTGYQALIGDDDTDHANVRYLEPRGQFAIVFKDWRTT
jgi:predicted O-methyltransferase YrrM